MENVRDSWEAALSIVTPSSLTLKFLLIVVLAGDPRKKIDKNSARRLFTRCN